MFGSFICEGSLAGTEEALEGSDVVIGVCVCVLELMYVPNPREILFIYVSFYFQRAQPLKYTSIRLIDFHNLKLLFRNLKTKRRSIAIKIQ